MYNNNNCNNSNGRKFNEKQVEYEFITYLQIIFYRIHTLYLILEMNIYINILFKHTDTTVF